MYYFYQLISNLYSNTSLFEWLAKEIELLILSLFREIEYEFNFLFVLYSI